MSIKQDARLSKKKMMHTHVVVPSAMIPSLVPSADQLEEGTSYSLCQPISGTKNTMHPIAKARTMYLIMDTGLRSLFKRPTEYAGGKSCAVLADMSVRVLKERNEEDQNKDQNKDQHTQT